MSSRAFGVLLAAVMLWDVLFRGQLGLSISFLEEMWARNLGHLFVTPLGIQSGRLEHTLDPRLRGCQEIDLPGERRAAAGRACFETRPLGAPEHEVCH